ncbi:MAG: aminopeptidase P family protein [Puniceicoccales bacterium]|jgi:Xaa-Pro aminopeptidase|nr:aminopeptidase P family protein [Puniceicoccales bacterium]
MTLRLIYASPTHSADLFYWGRIFTSDCFLAFEVEGQRYAIGNHLEIDELRRHSRFDRILLPEDLSPDRHPGTADLIQRICEKFPNHELLLPRDFPAYLVLELQGRGIQFSIADGEFLPERSLKFPEELIQIRRACSIIGHAFEAVCSILENSKIIDGFLHGDNGILTSEFLRSEIERICFSEGAIARETIVSCGADAAFPHNRGKGKLKANEFIVVDIFPRLVESGYYGDMTRTFLRGEPSKQQREMYDAVEAVQRWAIGEICAGKDGKDIHEGSVAMFKEMGYDTTHSTGFFHATGHGVGLDLHENPFIGERSHRLRSGEVITVEPGLYYPDRGGVRLEDVLLVREDGAEYLSNFSYDWVL